MLIYQAHYIASFPDPPLPVPPPSPPSVTISSNARTYAHLSSEWNSETLGRDGVNDRLGGAFAEVLGIDDSEDERLPGEEHEMEWMGWIGGMSGMGGMSDGKSGDRGLGDGESEGVDSADEPLGGHAEPRVQQCDLGIPEDSLASSAPPSPPALVSAQSSRAASNGLFDHTRSDPSHERSSHCRHLFPSIQAPRAQGHVPRERRRSFRDTRFTSPHGGGWVDDGVEGPEWPIDEETGTWVGEEVLGAWIMEEANECGEAGPGGVRGGLEDDPMRDEGTGSRGVAVENGGGELELDGELVMALRAIEDLAGDLPTPIVDFASPVLSVGPPTQPSPSSPYFLPFPSSSSTPSPSTPSPSTPSPSIPSSRHTGLHSIPRNIQSRILGYYSQFASPSELSQLLPMSSGMYALSAPHLYHTIHLHAGNAEAFLRSIPPGRPGKLPNPLQVTSPSRQYDKLNMMRKLVLEDRLAFVPLALLMDRCRKSAKQPRGSTPVALFPNINALSVWDCRDTDVTDTERWATSGFLQNRLIGSGDRELLCLHLTQRAPTSTPVTLFATHLTKRRFANHVVLHVVDPSTLFPFVFDASHVTLYLQRRTTGWMITLFLFKLFSATGWQQGLCQVDLFRIKSFTFYGLLIGFDWNPNVLERKLISDRFGSLWWGWKAQGGSVVVKDIDVRRRARAAGENSRFAERPLSCEGDTIMLTTYVYIT
ncbi:hypothetical protein IAT38_005297 [Cryptococcus sp. DSM 104549]